MSVGPQHEWGIAGRDGCVMGPKDQAAAEERLRRMIFEPGYLDRLLEEDRQQVRSDWLADPYYPIRNLRARGVEPSTGALNTLDGPAVCDRCGAADVEDSNPELLHPAEDICAGCGHVVCSRPSCSTPPSHIGRHSFDLHGEKLESR